MAEFVPDNHGVDSSGKVYNSKADFKFHKANNSEPDAAFHVSHNAPQLNPMQVKAANIANAR
jgi:hypothetical protein